jgi:hypothetical protein
MAGTGPRQPAPKPSMRPQLINLLGVSHPDKSWFAEQLAQGLQVRGVRARCLPDPCLEHWQQHEQGMPLEALAALETDALAQADHLRAAETLEHEVLLVLQPAANVWAMSQCLGAAQRDGREALAALSGSFMTLLLAAPPGAGQWHDVSGQISAHALEGHLRKAMFKQGVPYTPVWGQGSARVDQALAVVAHALDESSRLARSAAAPRWRWVCQDCDDGACEHESLRLLGR